MRGGTFQDAAFLRRVIGWLCDDRVLDPGVAERFAASLCMAQRSRSFKGYAGSLVLINLVDVVQISANAWRSECKTLFRLPRRYGSKNMLTTHHDDITWKLGK